MTRLPILPTVLVFAAIATMIALGIWQLGRADEKAVMLARFEAAAGEIGEADFPIIGSGEDVWFRRSNVNCGRLISLKAVAGTSAKGQKGWAWRAECDPGSDRRVIVDMGFSTSLSKPDWNGGDIAGVIAPGPRLVADPPRAGLQPLAKPDPKDLPNNHLAYAGQWFFFALTALVIYGFALRSRLRRKP